MKGSEKQKSKFLEVVCKRCGNKQVVFGRSSIDVKCLKCNKLLIRTSGGKTKVKTIVREVL